MFASLLFSKLLDSLTILLRNSISISRRHHFYKYLICMFIHLISCINENHLSLCIRAKLYNSRIAILIMSTMVRLMCGNAL